MFSSEVVLLSCIQVKLYIAIRAKFFTPLLRVSQLSASNACQSTKTCRSAVTRISKFKNYIVA